MADLEGRADSFVHLEYLQPDYVSVRFPEDNILFFTNHPLTEEARKQERGATPEAAANSRARFQVLEDLTRSAPKTPEGLTEVMSAHSSPARICQHSGVDGAVMDTDTSLVFVPQEQTLHISRGRPCEVGYDAVQLGPQPTG
jgi:hypothetical protein